VPPMVLGGRKPLRTRLHSCQHTKNNSHKKMQFFKAERGHQFENSGISFLECMLIFHTGPRELDGHPLGGVGRGLV